MEPLILANRFSPGDVVVMTAAVESLHRAHPGRYRTEIVCPVRAVWDHNPLAVRLDDNERGRARRIEMECPLIHESDRRAVHFMQGYCDFLADALGVPVPLAVNRPVLHLSDEEKGWMNQVHERFGWTGGFWLANAGTKRDFTAKGWGAANYQRLVDLLAGEVAFVQIGEAGHLHSPLRRVFDLRGHTDARQFIRLCWHARGGVGPSTFLQHVLAAFDKPYVCVAGGREPVFWLTYSHQTTLASIGKLPCCATGGCWKSRVVPLNDGAAHDGSTCTQPVPSADGYVPRCLDLIRPESVADAVRAYYEGGVLIREPVADFIRPEVPPARPLRLSFGHGAGDCVHMATLLQLYKRRGYDVRVHFDENKRAIWDIAGIEWCPSAGTTAHGWPHADGFNQPQPLPDWSGSKTALNLNADPLPDLGDRAALWDEVCGVQLDGTAVVTPELRAETARFLAGLPRPIVLLQSHGTTFADRKNLPAGVAVDLYRQLLDADCSIVLLDWDDRVPRLPHGRIRHLKADWGHIDLYRLAALYEAADLLVGIDSGPSHFASFFPALPALMVFHGFYPSCVALPAPKHVHLTQGGPANRAVNVARRKRWNVVEYAGPMPAAAEIVTHARRLLAGPRYLNGDHLGRDVMVQQWVRDWSRGETPLAPVADRDRTMDAALRLLSKAAPVVVEAGCCRSAEDWAGTGNATVTLAAVTDALGGRFVSVDRDPTNTAFARGQVAAWGSAEVVGMDPMAWLRQPGPAIDLLYLNSTSADRPGSAEYALAEVEASLARLNLGGVVVIDGTVWDGGWKGKGQLAAPFLLRSGFEMVASGYQCVFRRTNNVRP